VFCVGRGEQCDTVQDVATIRLLSPGHAGVISFADGSGHRSTAHAAWESGEALHLAAAGFEGTFRDILMLSPVQRGGMASGNCMAPMAGKILAVKVEPGETVKKGQPLCIIEAMKMEMEVPSPIDGVVQEVLVQPGLQVKPRTLMVRIEPQGEAAA
jgi:biotin carboxyl carrier protein